MAIPMVVFIAKARLPRRHIPTIGSSKKISRFKLYKRDTLSQIISQQHGIVRGHLQTIPSCFILPLGSIKLLSPLTLAVMRSLASQPTSARREGSGELSIQLLSPAHWILRSNQRTVFSHVIRCRSQHPFNY